MQLLWFSSVFFELPGDWFSFDSSELPGVGFSIDFYDFLHYFTLYFAIVRLVIDLKLHIFIFKDT